MIDEFTPYLVSPDADNTAWGTPGDLASERGRFTLTVTFDISPILSDEVMYAELAGSLAVALMRQSVHVVSVGLDDAACEV